MDLKDKLAVGTVTNMYSIVETMAKAGKNRQTIINLLTYLDKSRIPEEKIQEFRLSYTIMYV